MKWSETTVILQTFACYVAIFTNLPDCLFLLLASWTSSEIRLTLLIMRESCLKLNPTQIDDAQASLTHLSAVTTQRYWDSLWHIILKITTIEMRSSFLIISLLFWWNPRIMLSVGNLTKTSQTVQMNLGKFQAEVFRLKQMLLTYLFALYYTS